jgi:MFS transporter, PAT family, beta-lactamase induction signal transducer AmpG
VSGYIVEATSYSTFFVLSALTVIPTLALLAWLWRRIKEADPEPGGLRSG